MSWKTAWRYLPVNFGVEVGTLRDVTQQATILNNLSGNQIKILFSNKYGATPLRFERVTVARKRTDGEGLRDVVGVTCGGDSHIVLAPGEERYSDEVAYRAVPGEDIVISIYLKKRQAINSVCTTYAGLTWRSVFVDGDATNTGEYGNASRNTHETFAFFRDDINNPYASFGIAALLVDTDEDVCEVALFGDSITHMSLYTDPLVEGVYARYPGRVAFSNLGIGGNRLLHDFPDNPAFAANGLGFGEAGVKRFERDVYGGGDAPGYVFVMEGINDIMYPEDYCHPEQRVTAEQIEEGLSELARTARRHGSRIVFGTITPFLCDERKAYALKVEKVESDEDSSTVKDVKETLTRERVGDSLTTNVVKESLEEEETGGSPTAQDVQESIVAVGLNGAMEEADIKNYFVAEQVRRHLNTWILAQDISDGVVDVAAAIEDPVHPGRLYEDAHLGDWLHPNAVGGARMARAFLDKSR